MVGIVVSWAVLYFIGADSSDLIWGSTNIGTAKFNLMSNPSLADGGRLRVLGRPIRDRANCPQGQGARDLNPTP